MKKFLTNPFYLLPTLILVGLMIAGLHAADVWDSISSGRAFASAAMAQSKTETAPTASPAADAAKSAAPAADAGISAPPPDDADVSPAEMEVLKQLSDRRAQIDKRAKDLDTREALIRVAEQRVDQKIKEMETLRLQLQSMINQVSEAQAAQVENLVKIYETMKPEEAARIFETLDMPVLLSVIQRMKPAHTAPILAKMAPEKAKEITVALTKQDQLPQGK